MQRHSKQRDAIYDEIMSRKDHPTAEEIYFSLKSTVPNIGIATVYRNLSLLESEKKIIKIKSDSADRYDGDLSSHSHLICEKCGRVIDLCCVFPNLAESIQGFNGKILSQSVTFKGYCDKCTNSL